MNKTLLVGFVFVSLGAFAQSSANQGQTPNAKTATAPQDAASGQTSGKRMHKPVAMQQDAGVSGQATAKGGKTASDDWTAGAAAKTNGSNNGQASTRVATGDVNGDGRADLTATKSSGGATTGSATTGSATTKTAATASNPSAKSPNDAASGQASGKRQYRPVTVRKEVDAASPKLK
jgi:hypothetical protein